MTMENQIIMSGHEQYQLIQARASEGNHLSRIKLTILPLV